MKKKILLSLLLVFFCFVLVGCGTEVIDENEPVKEGARETEKDNDDKLDIELYSDSSKIVYDFSGVYKLVFDYSGDKITGYSLYFQYNSVEEATYARESIKAQYEEAEVEDVSIKGKYVVVKYAPSVYEDLTVEAVKTTYSYLQEIYK